ncbi:MAG: hypothetical protein E3J64_09250 [Anaerolineales bacterium]|nr:MAG: hypothetical protein E3J64_09250 [Anaerolineales bacterium]
MTVAGSGGQGRPRNFLRRLAFAAANLLIPLHTGLILAYCCLRWLGGADLWFVDALGYVLPWILAPTLLLLPAAIYRRSRLLIALAALPAILFLITYVNLFLPRWPVQTSGPGFSAMTYNVCWRNTDEEAIEAAIRAQAPQVLVLRELEPPMAEALQERLADLYPYRAIEPGCGLFTSFPILEYEAFRLSDDAYDFAQRLVLNVEGRPVTLLSVHPIAPSIHGFHPFGLPLGIPTGLASSGRDTDVRVLLQLLEEIEGPLVVLGDFNLSDQHELYAPLTDSLVDSYRESGWGMGFTFSPFGGPGLPMWRIDYVLHSRDLVSLSATVGDYGASDHRPLIATLAFRQ